MTPYLGGSSPIALASVRVALPPLTLDMVADQPALAAGLPPEVRQALAFRLAAVLAALAAGTPTSNSQPSASATPTTEGPEWLDADGVAQRFGLDRRWLADHAGELRRLRITTRPSRKRVLFHVVRLRRYLESRCG